MSDPNPNPTPTFGADMDAGGWVEFPGGKKKKKGKKPSEPPKSDLPYMTDE